MRHIYLFSSINSSSAESVIRQLLQYDRESNEEITIFINSPGGSVVDFFSIYNVMEMCKSPIKTVVIGMAASASAVLACVGDVRWMTEDSEFMLHEVWSFLIGSVSEMDSSVDRMKKMQGKLLNIISKHTKQSEDTIKEAIRNKDKYFDARESLSFGLTDRVIKANDADVVKLSEGIHVEASEFQYVNGKPEVELLCEGVFIHPVYGDITISEEVLNKMKENFDNKVRGVDISLDYTHDNEGGEHRAAAWIKTLEVISSKKGNKVLKANVEFTPRGQQLVSEKEYKYASADFAIDYRNEKGKHFPYVLRGGTLTNRPFIKELNPIKLSEKSLKPKETKEMNKEELILALKNQGIDVVSMEANLASLKAEIVGLQNKIKELAALPSQKEEEIKSLKDKLAEVNATLVKGEKDKAYDVLLSQGKVTPAQKEKIFATFDDASKMEEFYKDAPVIVKTKPQGSAEEEVDSDLTNEEKSVIAQGIYTKEQIIQNRTIGASKKSKSSKK